MNMKSHNLINIANKTFIKEKAIVKNTRPAKSAIEERNANFVSPFHKERRNYKNQNITM